MVDDLDRLARLGVDPAALEPAPDGPLRRSGYRARITPGSSHRSCSACGKQAVATRRVEADGLLWLDSCRDCMVARPRPGSRSVDAVDPDRYHLTVTTRGRPAVQGWWGSETVARGKFTTWVGEYGNLPDPRVTLVDEETGRMLTSWPDEP